MNEKFNGILIFCSWDEYILINTRMEMLDENKTNSYLNIQPRDFITSGEYDASETCLKSVERAVLQSSGMKIPLIDETCKFVTCKDVLSHMHTTDKIFQQFEQRMNYIGNFRFRDYPAFLNNLHTALFFFIKSKRSPL